MKAFLLSAMIVSIFAMGSTASAHSLRGAMREMAKDIKRYLDANEIEDIVVSTFSDPIDSTAGRALKRELQQQLKGVGVRVTTRKESRSKCQIVGEYSIGNNLDVQGTTVIVKVQLRTRNNDVESNFRKRVQSQEINDEHDLVKLLGITADFTTDATEASLAGTLEAKNEVVKAKLASAHANPKFHLASSSRVSASKSSPFGMEVLVRRDGSFEPLEVGDIDGLAFAPLQEGDTYILYIYNHAPHHVAVDICIDGVNTYELSEIPEARKLGKWIVKPGKTGIIEGWSKLNTTVYEFAITAAEDAVATKVGSPASEMGTITASFFKARSLDESKVASSQATDGTRSRSISGTGKGNEKQIESKQSKYIISDDLLASISIRYENPNTDNLPDDAPPVE